VVVDASVLYVSALMLVAEEVRVVPVPVSMVVEAPAVENVP
jgi:hypothetical protein